MILGYYKGIFGKAIDFQVVFRYININILMSF